VVSETTARRASDHRAALSDLPLNLFFFFVAVLIYTPITVLYLSHTAGSFALPSLVVAAMCCLIALMLPLLLSWRWRSAVDTFDSLLLGPALYVLIATTFLPVPGNVLDGTAREVSRIDRFLHVGLMAGCLLVSFAAVWHEPFKRRSQRVGTLFGLFAVASSAFMAAAILPLQSHPRDSTRYRAALSPNHNIIVVLFDMLEGSFAAEYFKRNPGAEEKFDGFVLYRNAASFAPFTALSYAGFMSGGYPANDQIHAGSVRDTIYYKENIIDDMAAMGYSPRYFSIITYENDNKKVVRIPDDVGLQRKESFFFFALAVRGRYLPYSYLPFGIKYMPWTQLEFGWMSKTDARDSLNWFVENVDVDPRQPKGFVWFHSLITHQPIRFDANGRFSMNLTADDAPGEIAYAFSLLQKLLVRLQTLNAYDNSLVIVVADHGYNILQQMKGMPSGAEYSLSAFGSGVSEGQYNPLLLVKKPGAHGNLRYTDTAVTLLDLRKSLREFASPGSGHDLEGFNFLGDERGSPNRTVQVIRFVGSTFDARKDFTDLTNWRHDTLRLPFAPTSDGMLKQYPTPHPAVQPAERR